MKKNNFLMEFLDVQKLTHAIIIIKCIIVLRKKKKNYKIIGRKREREREERKKKGSRFNALQFPVPEKRVRKSE